MCDLVGQTVELQHRLPLCWAAVHAGRVPAWRARRVAAQTMGLSADAAAWLDRQVARSPRRHRVP